MALDALNELVGKLPELRAEHDRLGRLIEAIEAFAQNGGASGVSTTPALKHGGKIVLRPDLFYSKSTSEATKMYLTMVGQAIGVREITQALVQGGIGSTPEATYANVSSALKRLKKAGEVEQPKRNLWGLSIWYGGAKKKRDAASQNGDDAANGEKEPGGA